MDAVTIFDTLVPFPQRVQWLMLSTALDNGVTAQQIAERLGWSLLSVRRLVWKSPDNMRLRHVAEWFHACGVETPKFSIVRR